jgi:hypothetical protein
MEILVSNSWSATTTPRRILGSSVLAVSGLVFPGFPDHSAATRPLGNLNGTTGGLPIVIRAGVMNQSVSFNQLLFTRSVRLE